MLEYEIFMRTEISAITEGQREVKKLRLINKVVKGRNSA